jgi:hypothetical protein
MDDRAAAETPSVIAGGYLNPDARRTAHMHEKTPSLATMETMLHRVGHQLVGDPRHGLLVRDRARTLQPKFELHHEFSTAGVGHDPLAVFQQPPLEWRSLKERVRTTLFDDRARQDQWSLFGCRPVTW